ncbi:phage tail protein [Salinicola endophyticus]|uniref:Phage tail protein n=1 Tax=Salinicola endophyticus TaxID=1949083 RepID=A0ABY8FC59_9GAMM|nr:phage tail assembly chaperone [Salinicola endophyticus]WFF40394.1 phage tail protein [Salinicola endophyticus]
MAKQQAKIDIRGLALSPLAGYRHESVEVAEWDGAIVVLREPSAGDWTAWQAKLAAMTGEEVTPDNVKTLSDGVDGTDRVLDATLLVRVLYGEDNARVFSDEDVDAVAKIYGPVHDRLLRRALELGGLTDAPLEQAEKN